MRAANLGAGASSATGSAQTSLPDGVAAGGDKDEGLASKAAAAAVLAGFGTSSSASGATAPGAAITPGDGAAAAAVAAAAVNTDALTRTALFSFKRDSPWLPRCLQPQPLKPGTGPLGPLVAHVSGAGVKRRRDGDGSGDGEDGAGALALDVDGEEPRYMARGQMLPSTEIEARRIHDEMVLGISSRVPGATGVDAGDPGSSSPKRRRTGGRRRPRPAPSRVRARYGVLCLSCALWADPGRRPLCAVTLRSAHALAGEAGMLTRGQCVCVVCTLATAVCAGLLCVPAWSSAVQPAAQVLVVQSHCARGTTTPTCSGVC